MVTPGKLKVRDGDPREAEKGGMVTPGKLKMRDGDPREAEKGGMVPPGKLGNLGRVTKGCWVKPSLHGGGWVVEVIEPQNC